MIHLSRVLLCLVSNYVKPRSVTEAWSLVDAVERAAGLSLFSEAVKAGSKHICKTTKCDVTIRRFDDAQKKGSKAIAAPK